MKSTQEEMDTSGQLFARESSDIEKQRRFFVDNLMLGVQLADVSTRCSSHP